MYSGVLLLTLMLSFSDARKCLQPDEHRIKQEISDGIGKFGVNLHKYLMEQNFEQGDNVVISPLSVYFSLALTHLGSAGTTRDEITNVMGLPKDENILTCHKSIGLLHKLLQYHRHVNVTITHALFLQNGINVQNIFKFLVNYFYDGKIIDVDFTQKTSVDQINQWFENESHGKLKRFYNQPFSSDTKLLLANALTFTGEWNRYFPKENTATDTFFGENGEEEVMMMRKIDKIHFYDNPTGTFEIIGIPYKNEEYYMYIVLPKESQDLKTIIEQMSLEQIQNMIRKCTKRTVDVKMPQMLINTSNQLKNVMQQMGIEKLFTSADLSNMVMKMDLKVTDILQNVYFKINEQGTDVSVGTTQEIKTYNEFINENDVRQFYVQRPFMFFIYEPSSKIILYHGSIMNVKNHNNSNN
ncbi:hypothetical protein PGB90_004219 [Kerria lacca]